MTIIINKKDSKINIRQKIRKASREAQRIKQKDIRELCGVLKGKLKGDPVEIIRKLRDAEWN